MVMPYEMFPGESELAPADTPVEEAPAYLYYPAEEPVSLGWKAVGAVPALLVLGMIVYAWCRPRRAPVVRRTPPVLGREARIRHLRNDAASDAGRQP